MSFWAPNVKSLSLDTFYFWCSKKKLLQSRRKKEIKNIASNNLTQLVVLKKL